MAVGFLDFSRKHTVVELTDMLATKVGRLYHLQAAKDHDNGVIVGVGEYLGEDYFAEVAAPAGLGLTVLGVQASGAIKLRVTKAVDGAVLVTDVAKNYYEFESMAKDEDQYFIAKGDIERAHSLYYGDKFALSAEGFVDATKAVKGAVMVVDTTGKLKIKA